VTALLALVPMGATLVWMPVGIVLVLTEQPWQGIGLLLWGFLVVSTVDNVIRPLVISGAGRIPFLVVLFGVLGGLSAFGAIGLFLGPVILAVLLSVWQAWLKLQQHEEQIRIGAFGRPKTADRLAYPVDRGNAFGAGFGFSHRLEPKSR